MTDNTEIQRITREYYEQLYANVFNVDHNKLWKILKEMWIPDHLTCSWELWIQVKKQQLELDVEQQTGSK